MSQLKALRWLAALLLLSLVLPAAARGEQSSSFIRPTKPGSREAAVSLNRLQFVHPTMGGVYKPNKSGLLVPDRRLILTDAKSRTDQARWYGTRRGVLHYLKKGGARMSPAPYQKLVKKIRRRAELTLRREGKSLSSWKMMVLEGGKADQVNAAAWSGGVITIYRPLVDLCFQIANVTVNTHGSSTKLDAELWKLSRWRKNKKSGVPESLRVPRGKVALRDKLAESILSRVVLHEMGHAASGHVELKDPELIIPGKHQPRDLAKTRDMEREADHFATMLATKGAVRVPGVMPLFSYYNFISRPNFQEKGPRDVAEWRTHPIDAERYNNQLSVLQSNKRTRRLTKGLPELLQPRIIGLDGKLATPTKQADVVPLRPTPRAVKPQALPRAAAR